MAYPIRHKLLTMVGSLYSGIEHFSMGMRIIPPTGFEVVTQAECDAAATICSTWFAAVNTQIPALHHMNYVKLAPIGTDGHYPPGEDSVETDFAGLGTAGAGATTQTWPPQCAVAITLTTAATRGVGHVGRFYMPPLASLLGSDALLPSSVVDQVLGTTRTMLLGLNGVTNLGTVGVVTKTGVSGSSRVVTGLAGGRVVDTQRRRRRSLSELPRILAL